ncbi:Retrovirus-related Pol polyprotein from transposon TNT 1-94 [Senna tora]|uniref:Retrovirus-related Pol polyprotein from transposon TNT 1-94 n=1 Tax=Senna tora TaxID=362788 RepID=A0A834T0T3_9FABA|nr:Retrovirus-related Pol polyprotein from transposon TNT 1-94 [Senna tora]
MAANTGLVSSRPPMLSGENNHIWAIIMKAYLRALSLWSVLESDANHRLLQQMQLQLKGGSMRRKWPRNQEFEGSERVKAIKLTHKREFEMLKMKEEDFLKDYSSKLLEVVNRIRLLGEEFSYQKVVEKMLISLPSKFEAKVSTMEEFCGLKTPIVAELISKLQAQEHRTKMRDDEVVEGAFFAKQKGKQGSGSAKKGYVDKRGKHKNGKNTDKKEKFPPCSICQRDNHLEKDCWYKGKGPIQCRFCEKVGHIEKNCRKKQGCSYDGGVWLVDSGCTSHMCKEEKVFCNLDKSVQIKVTPGNGEVMQSQRKGSVTFSSRQEQVMLFIMSKMMSQFCVIEDLVNFGALK